MNKLKALILLLLLVVTSRNLNAQNWRSNYESINKYENVLGKDSVFVVYQKYYAQGLCDEMGRLIIPMEYQYFNIKPFCNYIGVRKNDKHGVINLKNEIVVPIEYDNYIELAYKAFVVRKDNAYSVLKEDGTMLFPFQKDYIGVGEQGFIISTQEDKTVVFFPNGKTIVADAATETNTKDKALLGVRQKEGKFGFYDHDENTIIPFEYDDYSADFAGTNEVILRKDKLKGLVNVDNKIVLPFQYDDIYQVYGFKHFENHYVITKNKKKAIFDAKGKEILPFEYDDFQFADFVQTHYIASKNGKYGLVKLNGKMEVPYEYDQMFFANFDKKTYLQVQKNKKNGILSLDNKIVIPLEYDGYWVTDFKWRNKTYLFATKGEKSGIINFDNQVVIPFEYDGIDIYGNWKMDSLLYVTKGEKRGLINPKNELVLPFVLNLEQAPIFVDSIIYCLNDNKYAAFNIKGKQKTDFILEKDKMDYYFKQFKEGKRKEFGEFSINSNNQKAIFSFLKGELLTAFYDDIDWENIVKQNDKYGVLDEKKKLTVPIEYDYIRPISFQKQKVFVVSKDKKIGIVSIENKTLVDFEYDNFSDISYRAANFDPWLIISKNKKFGVMTTKKEVVIPFLYKGIRRLSNQCFEVYEETNEKINPNSSYFKLIFGAIDTSGKMIFPVQYSAIKVYDDSLFIIEKNNKKGLFDRKAKQILALEYDDLTLVYPNKLVIVTKNNKKGIFYTNGTAFLPIEYDDIKDNSNSNFILTKAGVTSFIDANKKAAFSENYDRVTRFGSHYQVKNKGKFGLLSYDYKLLIPIEYDTLEYVDYFPAFWKIKKNKLYGIADRDGKITIIPKYEKIDVDIYEPKHYIAKKGKYYGVVANNDKEIVAFEYDEIWSRLSKRNYEVRKNKFASVVDYEGKVLIPFRFEDIGFNINDYTYEVVHKSQLLHYNTLAQKLINPKAELYERFGAFQAKSTIGYDGLLCIELDDLWGFMTMDKKIIQYPYYQDVRGFERRHYLVAVKNNDKWGVYNLKTKQEVVATIYDDVDVSQAAGFALLKKENLWSYADEKGNLMAEFNNDNKDFFVKIREKNKENIAFQAVPIAKSATKNISFGNYAKKQFSEGLIPFKHGASYGFTNLKGDFIIAPKYEDVHTFHEGLAVVYNNKQCAVINKKGEIVIPFKYGGIEDFSEGFAITSINRKYGIINEAGKEILPPIASYILPFKENLAAFRHPKTEKWGFLDRNGKEAIPAQFDQVSSFSEGLAQIFSKGKKEIGFIDKTGKIVIDFKYKAAEDLSNQWNGFINGKMRVATQNNYKIIIDKQGKSLFDEGRKYKSISRFYKGFATATKENGNIDWIDTLGNVIEKPKGLTADNYGISEEFEHREILSNFEYVSPLINGFAQAKINNHWGYIDDKGNSITPFIYDETSMFDKGGIAAVRIGNYGFLINTKGECILNCPEKPLISIEEKKVFHTYFSDDLNQKIMYLVPFRKDKKWGYMMRETKEIVVPAIMDSCAFAKDNELLFVEKGKKYTIDFYHGFSPENDGFELDYNPKYNSISHQKQNAKNLEGALPMTIVMEEPQQNFQEPPPPINLAPEYGERVAYTSFNGTICVEKNGKFGIVNNKNELIVPHKYDKFWGIKTAQLHDMFIDQYDRYKAFKYYLFSLKGELFYVDENGVEYRP